MFNDLRFRDRMQLAAVNSINWARIVAQLTYYFVAAVALGGPARPVGFAVPTGNFGDIFAGFAAKTMGLPTERLVIATNENDILYRAWNSGIYAPSQVVATSSPSMDIQVSSNFERFLYEASGLDAAAVGDCIRRVKAESGYLIDPHSACALVAARRTQAATGARHPMIALATAHPAKFPDAIEAITGQRPALPARLASLLTDPERITTMANDLGAVKGFVERCAEAAWGPVT